MALRLAATQKILMRIDHKILFSGYDRKTCWVHARPAVIPGDPLQAVITMQKLRITGDDVFYEINDVWSQDGGTTWSQPRPHADVLGRRPAAGGLEEGISDFTPAWHSATGVLLGTGHTIPYLQDNIPPNPRPRSTSYSVYNQKSQSWSAWAKLEMLDPRLAFNTGAGCTQRVDLANGDILLPIYYALSETVKDAGLYVQLVSSVHRCTFDGTVLRCVEKGSDLTLGQGRGFGEPSLAEIHGRYFLTLRNDDRAYVAVSRDGLNYGEPQPWKFDDGSDLGSYNTQQHWVTSCDNLYLVYTRRGANNDHVLRHRAPLFIAQVDQERNCLLRESEAILIPERGAALGNFGVARISDQESWVVASEWMQTTQPDPFDCRVCEKYGSDNSIHLARISFG